MSKNSIQNPTIPVDIYESCYWYGNQGCVGNLAISNAASQNNAPFLLLCENNEQAEQSIRELKYFCAAHDEIPILSLPDWETLPYDNFSPHQDIISERLNTLFRLPQLKRGILVLSITSLMHRLPPYKYIAANTFDLIVGQQLESELFRKQLSLAGYQAVDSVFEHGEFAVRGSIIDIFPMGSPAPFRIDLFDDEIETLRTFNPETQRSERQVQEIKLLPGREYPLDDSGIATFRNRFHQRFEVDPRQCPFYQDVSNAINSPGLEYYLALFFDQLSSLFEFIPENTIVISQGDLHSVGQQFWLDIESRYEDRRLDSSRPILHPDDIFIRVDKVLSQAKGFRQIKFRKHNKALDLGGLPLPNLASSPRLTKPFSNLQQFLHHKGTRALFCAESLGRKQTLIELLKQSGIKPTPVDHWSDFVDSDNTFCITVAPLDQGLWLKTEDLALITETQLFENRIAQRRRRSKTKSNVDFLFKSLSELHINDAVVHIDHGVGRYRGLQTITTDGHATEFLTLEYANQAILYVPVAALNLISRYSSAEHDSAPLNHLGTDQWQRTKRKAAKKVHDVAVELLEIYAKRNARQGHKYKMNREEYEKFSSSFHFEETPDQESSIEAVIADMSSSRPMDRLVCGDVGFGKTEVAMRAAFIAVQNSKQVVVLVPTTLLAQQHYESFKDRFASWPIEVDVLSRFKSISQQNDVLRKVAGGRIDILIGTHKLLHSKINYSDLGLLIIDEEHRFGVRQKEKLKALRTNVDVLTLTATPIPRTLNMALSEIRDLSLIVTPPARRLSVKTFVREQQDSLIKEAISRELLRGGQVFYLHNEVKSINRAAEHLQTIIPQARICVAHGQMAERELENVMADFYHKRYNILVCTTIIETGIDIPSANTILIQRADKLGLAQLHQLRGRVGRSHHQAYAYLLLPSHSQLNREAHKRIEAIQAATTLGAGFTLASHDLEIRGAGELLGDEQSGHIQKIGFSLYTDLLEEAVDAIKAGKIPNLELEPNKPTEVNLRIPALIPEDYLPDIHTRLIMYKRIASSRNREELEELQVEMIDRFGLLPESLKLLFHLTELKLKAQELGIKKIDANANSGKIEFKASTKVDPLSLVRLIQEDPILFKLGNANQLQFFHKSDDPKTMISFINSLLHKFKIGSQPVP